MKGVVFNILEGLIVEEFGDVIMEEIYSSVQFSGDVLPFVGPESYPDSDLFAMVGYLSDKTSIPVDDLVFEFGKYMLPVFYQNYPVFFENMNSPIEFLKTVNDIIHVEVKKLFEDATPPIIIVEQENEKRVTLKYYSERKLCRLLEGLLEGLALHFNKEVSYTHKECMKTGADQCVYSINFQ